MVSDARIVVKWLTDRQRSGKGVDRQNEVEAEDD
jgi:hypothetical protein